MQGGVILLLLLALIVSLILGVPAMQRRSGSRVYYIQKMMTECDAALQKIQRLSRFASGTSVQTLAEIRSCVYGIDILNQAYNSQEGKTLIDQSGITELYALLESYANQLISGTDTGALQSAIFSAVQELYQVIQNVS